MATAGLSLKLVVEASRGAVIAVHAAGGLARGHVQALRLLRAAEGLCRSAVAVLQADGGKIMTIEGLANNGELHPLQEGFWEKHGLQCGYCTPGMIMSAYDLLQRNPDPSEREIRNGLSGNLCRCTGYHNIVKSVQFAAEKMRS